MDIHNTYHLPTAVAMFLNRLNPDIFSKVEGNPSDVITNPRRTDTYTIRITNGYAGTREIQGTFDKKGLPVDWPNFAKQIQKATVKRTIFCPPENAPYPIEKIKKIYIPKGLT